MHARMLSYIKLLKSFLVYIMEETAAAAAAATATAAAAAITTRRKIDKENER